jgi:hypothetical protein
VHRDQCRDRSHTENVRSLSGLSRRDEGVLWRDLLPGHFRYGRFESVVFATDAVIYLWDFNGRQMDQDLGGYDDILVLPALVERIEIWRRILKHSDKLGMDFSLARGQGPLLKAYWTVLGHKIQTSLCLPTPKESTSLLAATDLL